tara:strand:- start:1550 stop:3136 length:1587 start_codon:yes stop_codon:yes gene_type:complete
MAKTGLEKIEFVSKVILMLKAILCQKKSIQTLKDSSNEQVTELYALFKKNCDEIASLWTYFLPKLIQHFKGIAIVQIYNDETSDSMSVETLTECISPLITLLDVCSNLFPDKTKDICDALFEMSKKGDNYVSAMVNGGVVPILLRGARKFEDTDENDKADKDSNDKVVRGATCVLVSLSNRCEESRRLMLQNDVGPSLAIRMLEKSASPDQERLSMELIRNLSPWAADRFVPVVKLLIDKAEMILDNFPHTSHNINYFTEACFKALCNICKYCNEARKTLAYDSRCVDVIMKISKVEDGCFLDTGISLMKYVLKVVCNRDDVYSTADQVHEPLDIMKLTVRKFCTAGAIELLVGELNTNRHSAFLALGLLLQQTSCSRTLLKMQTTANECGALKFATKALGVTYCEWHAAFLLKWLIYNNTTLAEEFENQLQGISHTVKLSLLNAKDNCKWNLAEQLCNIVYDYAKIDTLAAWTIANSEIMGCLTFFAKSDDANVRVMALNVFQVISSALTMIERPKKRARCENNDED